MATPAEVVNSSFTLAQSYASAATTQLTAFTQALNDSIYAPPTISVTWNTLPAPTLQTMPGAPTMPDIEFHDPGGTPNALNESIPEMHIDNFNETAPTINLPDAVSPTYGAVPAIPAVANVPVPTAPTLSMPSAPSFLSLSTVAFSGVDLREDWLDRLESIPELVLSEPTPYSYALGPEYASALLDNLKATLNSRLAGGTGLSASIEQAIWDRARGRETNVALANEQEVMRTAEASGFHLPSGAVAAQLREAQKAYYDKLSDLSRDVAIKQAELEQENLRQTIDAGMRMEGMLIDYSSKLEQLSFETARAYADNAIQAYNAKMAHFNALLDGYKTYASTYKTIIDGQMAKVEVYRAQLQAEQTKSDFNKALVEQYKAQIEASMSQVKIYEAQVGAAKTLVDMEQAKIGAAGEQIKAYVAQVNAETAKVESYKAQVQGEVAKLDAYKARAGVYATVVGAQAEHSRALISRYSAISAAKSAEWDGYKARVLAESARMDALGKQSAALLDGYKAETAAVQASAELQSSVWQSNMKQYEAAAQITIQAARVNNDATIQTNNARLDAAKAGAQVYAQLTSSAYGMIHASAGVSASGGTSVSYSYGGDVSGTVPPIAAI